MTESDGNTFYKVGFGLLAAAALFIGLFVNGALPGFMVPTTGQAIWTLGFAQSFANGFSIYATNFGLPTPAAISFGLAGALPTALFLKVGIPPADAYALTFALWFTVAFYGAYRFARLVGGRGGISLLCALLWLTLPVIWQHSDYSMVSLGIALLPSYFYAALRLVRHERNLRSSILFFAATLCAAFMDGYTFIMFATGVVVLLLMEFILRPSERRNLSYICLPIAALSFALSYILYTAYIGKPKFDGEDIDFFRAFGSNLEFFLVPTRGLLWIPDFIGFSAVRNEINYFGDASVFNASFSLVLIIAAIYSLATKSSDIRLKVAFLLVGLCGFYMALGPSFKFNVLRPEGISAIMPLQYAPLRTGTDFLSIYLPGFNNMRASYRWVALGMFGAWALLTLHIANHRTQSVVTIVIILAGIAFNIPTRTVIEANIESRRTIYKIDDYIVSLKPIFRSGEKVAFLPFRNDFFVNYMASKLEFRTYNIGGDKNLAAAMENWPVTMRAFEFAQAAPDFEKRILTLLATGDADVVVIPYIDLLWAADAWPYPPLYLDEMQPHVNKLELSGMVDITRTENFAAVRLRSRAQAVAPPSTRITSQISN